jgi:hypothetical protein|tara:strand:+ start:179 stop:424 length:246 start_codon:yes stop_codon:yes gene_type:complete
MRLGQTTYQGKVLVLEQTAYGYTSISTQFKGEVQIYVRGNPENRVYLLEVLGVYDAEYAELEDAVATAERKLGLSCLQEVA